MTIDRAPREPRPKSDVLDPDVARRVRNLTMQARRAVEGLLSGVHRSPHRGASVVFVDHREYRPGDDLRLLDWRAFARTDRDVIKRFEQETQLRATLVLDRSSSMAFVGSNGVRKSDHAAALLAALAYLLVSQGDAVGAALVSDRLGPQVTPGSRPAHVDAILELLAQGTSADGQTDIERALGAVAERIGRRGVVVLASDLLDTSPTALVPLRHLVARGHDVLVLHVMTPDELELPEDRPARFTGLEGEEHVDADPSEVRDSYLEEVERFLQQRRDLCLASGARYALCRTDASVESVLASLLARSRRGRAR